MHTTRIAAVLVAPLAAGALAVATPAAGQGANPEQIADGGSAGYASLSEDGNHATWRELTDPDDSDSPTLPHVLNRSTGSVRTFPDEAGRLWEISGDGKYGVSHTAENGDGTADMYRRELATGKIVRMPRKFDLISSISVSDNGKWVGFFAWEDDGNAIYRWNVVHGKLTRIASGYVSSGPVMSGDGRKIAFTRDYHTYLRDIANGTTTLIDGKADGTPANAGSAPIAMSRTGSYVLLKSYATDLVPGTEACPQEGDANFTYTCLYRRNVAEQKMTLASVSADGKPVTAEYGAMSSDGRVVAFTEYIDQWSDDPRTPQAYARRLSTGQTRTVSANADGQPGGYPPWFEANALDGDGSTLVFSSNADNYGEPCEKNCVWLADTGV